LGQLPDKPANEVPQHASELGTEPPSIDDALKESADLTERLSQLEAEARAKLADADEKAQTDATEKSEKETIAREAEKRFNMKIDKRNSVEAMRKQLSDAEKEHQQAGVG
jgi:translation initiation factor IF-2